MAFEVTRQELLKQANDLLQQYKKNRDPELKAQEIRIRKIVADLDSSSTLGSQNLQQTTDLGATTTNAIDTGGITTDYVQLDTAATPTLTPGMFSWNAQEGTANLRLLGNNVTLYVGQQEYARVVNKTSPLVNLLKSNYQVVKVTGATGQRLSIKLARADSDLNSASTLGLVAENIGGNQEGFIVTNGLIRDINTTGALQGETWNDGDTLYLSGTTFGQLTNIKPSAPIHTVIIGFVEYAHNNHGKIFVKIDNGYELNELHNVNITEPVANGSILRYNAVGGYWNEYSGYTGNIIAGGFDLSFQNGILTSAVLVDLDALAFITAAEITNVTQQSAIKTLVADLKGYGLWTKMRAIYPFVGGTVSSHRWNLKDPRDLNAAFRLVFSGGGTHASTGWTPNGVNAYSNTFFTANTLSSTSAHLSFYSRTDTAAGDKCEIGGVDSNGFEADILVKHTANLAYPILGFTQYPSVSNTNSQGFYIARRNDGTNVILDKNGNKILTALQTPSLPNLQIYIGAQNRFNTSIVRYSDRECAFASIGDGLTDTEAANLYIAVQKYQTTLGRHVGVPIVADADAQAFLNAAEITNITQANAINKLVTDLKGYGLWTKMRAIYPFVGGTASSHRWNLKDPRDLDAAFRLNFFGGWTHSSDGALPNGTNAGASTFFTPSGTLSQNSIHLSYYSRTNNTANGIEIGAFGPTASTQLQIMINSSNNNLDAANNNATSISRSWNTDGLFLVSRTSSTEYASFRNSTKIITRSVASNGNVNRSIWIGGRNNDGIYTNRQCAFASIGDGLTDAEAANLYTAVQEYQVALSRNV